MKTVLDLLKIDRNDGVRLLQERSSQSRVYSDIPVAEPVGYQQDLESQV